MVKTLTGLTMDEVKDKIDVSLPQDAYKKIGGSGSLDFTDIDPGWMRKAFNSIFGLCGYGWGISYESSDIVLDFLKKDNGKETPVATFKKLVFWYALDDEGRRIECQIHATGSHKNEQGNIAYALKGALTNALGNAASSLGWQESIYLGYRSHDNIQGHVPTAPKKEKTPDPTPNPNAPAETTKPANAGESPVTDVGGAKSDSAPQTAKADTTSPANTTPASVVTPPATQPATPTADEIKKDIEAITAKLKTAGFSTRPQQFVQISKILNREVKSHANLIAEDRKKILAFELPLPDNSAQNPTGQDTNQPAGTSTVGDTQKPNSEKPLKFSVCNKCFEVHTDREIPTKCRKCGHNSFAIHETLLAARDAIRNAPPATPPATKEKKTKLFELCGKIGCKTGADAAGEISHIIERKITSSEELTIPELDKAISFLTELCEQQGL